MQLDDAIPFVSNELPSCPDAVIKQQMVLALQEFCRETRCWQQTLDPIQLVSGQREYDATPDNNAARVHVLDRVDCVGLGELHLMDADQQRPIDWSTAQSSTPTRVYASADGQSFSIYPQPFGHNLPQLLVQVRLVPKLNVQEMPDEVLDKHIEAIASGTKARLMAMINRPWSNPATAGMHRTLFVSAMTDARASSGKTHVARPSFVRPPPFF